MKIDSEYFDRIYHLKLRAIIVRDQFADELNYGDMVDLVRESPKLRGPETAPVNTITVKVMHIAYDMIGLQNGFALISIQFTNPDKRKPQTKTKSKTEKKNEKSK